MTVKLLKQQGKIEEARKKISQEVFRQTGAVPGTTEDIAGSLNVIASYFNQQFLRNSTKVSYTVCIAHNYIE